MADFNSHGHDKWIVPVDDSRYLEALGARIDAVVARLGGKREAAKLTHISEPQLYRYIRGANSPTALPIAALARVGGVSVEWLLTGQGSMEPQPENQSAGNGAELDQDLVTAIVRGIFEGYKRIGYSGYNPVLLSSSLCGFYAYFMRSHLDSATRLRAAEDSIPGLVESTKGIVDFTRTHIDPLT